MVLLNYWWFLVKLNKLGFSRQNTLENLNKNEASIYGV